MTNSSTRLTSGPEVQVSNNLSCGFGGWFSPGERLASCHNPLVSLLPLWRAHKLTSIKMKQTPSTVARSVAIAGGEPPQGASPPAAATAAPALCLVAGG